MSSLQQLSVSGVVDSSRSVMLVMCTVSCNFPHAVIYWIQMWRIWRTQLRGINSEISFCNSSTVTWAQWAFQVSQGSVETLFRWGGKHLTSFCNKFIQETVYQMLLESPEFCKKILHKTFWSLSFFLYTLYIQLYSSSDYDSNSDHILIVIYLRLREHKLRPVIKFISQGVCCVAGRYLSHRRCRFEILK